MSSGRNEEGEANKKRVRSSKTREEANATILRRNTAAGKMETMEDRLGLAKGTH